MNRTSLVIIHRRKDCTYSATYSLITIIQNTLRITNMIDDNDDDDDDDGDNDDNGNSNTIETI